LVKEVDIRVHFQLTDSMPIRFFAFSIVLSLTIEQCAWSQVLLSDAINEYHLGTEVSYLEDANHLLTFQRVQSQQKQFRPFPSINPNFGFTNSSYWLHWKLNNRASQTMTNWLLEVGYSAYAEIDVYLVDESGKMISQAAGDWRSTQNRILSFHNYVFPLPLIPQKEYQVYMRLRPLIGQVVIPITIWKSTAFTHYAELYNLFWGIYIGMLLIVLLYHGIVYLFNQHTVGYEGYLYLTGYLLIYLVFELTRGSCLGVRYLWAGNRWMTDNGFITLFFAMVTLFATFYGKMLDLKQYTPKLLSIIRISLGIWGGALLLIYSHVIIVSKNAVTLLAGTLVGGFIIVASYRSWQKRRDYRPGLYYLLAAFMLYAGGVVLLLTRWGLFPSGHFFSMNALNVGSLLEFVMLSIGLGLQIQWERQKNRQQVRETQETQIALLEKTYFQAQEEERKELSMLLHDQFANELWTLRYNIQKLYTEYISTLNATRLEEALSTIKKVLEGIRTISNYYIPDRFEEKGLKMMLQELTRRLGDTTSVRYLLHLKGHEEQLPTQVQLQLYYVVFELTANITKHAQATEAGLISYRENGYYVFQIRDNGRGGLPKIEDSKGSGLKNIQRRLNSIGAILEVQSLEEEGTTTVIRITLSHPF
jgi:signal transduction histidine kinase